MFALRRNKLRSKLTDTDNPLAVDGKFHCEGWHFSCWLCIHQILSTLVLQMAS